MHAWRSYSEQRSADRIYENKRESYILHVLTCGHHLHVCIKPMLCVMSKSSAANFFSDAGHINASKVLLNKGFELLLEFDQPQVDGMVRREGGGHETNDHNMTTLACPQHTTCFHKLANICQKQQGGDIPCKKSAQHNHVH